MSIRSFVAFLIALVIAPSLRAEMPDVSIIQNRRYVIRSAFGMTDAIFHAEAAAGVWSWHVSGQLERLWPLVYGKAGNGAEAGLAAREDVVVVQGTTFLEFDAATHRLLRRHAALDEHLQGWGFRGPYVSERAARALGIAPGYYGFVYCPPDASIGGAACGPSDFPSRPGARDGLGNLLYRRGLTRPTLTLEKRLATGPLGLPAIERRHITFDEARERFWTRHSYPTTSNTENRLGYLSLTPSGIQDEVTIETAPAGGSRHAPLSVFYDRISDTILTPWSAEGEPYYVTARAASLTSPDTRIYTATNPVWGLPLAFATLSPTLPKQFEQVVPIIGKGPGAYGTYWQSDVWIYNPSATPMTVHVRRVSKPSITRDFNLPAFASVQLTDALGMLGGGPAGENGDGVTNDALVIQAPYRWGAQATVYSRTYTSSDDGTYGQAVPAVPSRTGYSTHTYNADPATDTWADAPEFYVDLREPGRFRHNLGIVNDEDEPLEMRLYYGVATVPRPGQELPTQTITVAPRTVANISLEALLRPETRFSEPSMFKIGGSRPAPIWLAIVDNKTGDSTFLPFATFGLLGAFDSSIAVPQIANTPGANGTYWRSDLYGFFHPPASAYDQLPQATFYPNDPARCGGNRSLTTTLTGPSGQPGVTANDSEPSVYRRVFPDVVAQFTPCSQGTMGALEMHLGSWMAGFTRTYTTRSDGGTYGDILPFYPSGGWPVQHFTGLRIDGMFRTNLGLYNGLDYSVVHRLLVYDQAGREVGRAEHTIASRRSVQAPLSAFTGSLPDGVYSMSVIPLDQPGAPGRSWAYVAVVDNKSGDTTNFW